MRGVKSSKFLILIVANSPAPCQSLTAEAERECTCPYTHTNTHTHTHTHTRERERPSKGEIVVVFWIFPQALWYSGLQNSSQHFSIEKKSFSESTKNSKCHCNSINNILNPIAISFGPGHLLSKK